MSEEEVRLSIDATVREDAGSWICKAQVFQNRAVKVGDALEYSIELVIVGEDICASKFVWIICYECL